MPKVLSRTANGGIEILAAYNTGPHVLEAAVDAEPQVLGTFKVALDCQCVLEVVGALPSGGTGVAYLYDSTPGELEEREVENSRTTFVNEDEARMTSRACSLEAGHLYQIRAFCQDASPTGKLWVIQGSAAVDK